LQVTEVFVIFLGLFGALAVIRRPHSVSAPDELCPPSQQCRRRGRRGASAPQKNLFVENPGKTLENPGKILENSGKIPENPGKNGAQRCLNAKNRPNICRKHMETFFGDSHQKKVFMIPVGKNL